MTDLTLVLVHGLAQDPEQLSSLDVASGLGGVSCELVTPCLKGGTLDDMADEVSAIIARCHRPVMLGGVSMGAAVAAHAIVTGRCTPDGLVQIAPAVTPAGLVPAAGEFIRFLADSVAAGGYGGLEARLLEAEALDAMTAEQIAVWRSAFTEDEIVALWREFVSSARLQSWDALRTVVVPTLVVVWPDDSIHPVEVGHDYKTHLPRSRLVEIATPRGRQLDGDDLAGHLRAFVAEVASAGGVEEPDRSV